MDNERNEKSILIEQGVTDRREDKIWSRKEKGVGHCKSANQYATRYQKWVWDLFHWTRLRPKHRGMH